MRSRYGFVVVATLALFASTFVEAGERRSRSGGYDTYAKVTDVQPIVRVVQVSTPRTTCWDEPAQRTVRAPRYRSFTPAVVGGILGGIVGNQFGSGSGQTAMTIAGSLLGASIGRDTAYRNRRGGGYAEAWSPAGSQQRCEVEEISHAEERVEGYRVTYRFHGRDYVTQMASDPGDELRVRVRVEPAGGA